MAKRLSIIPVVMSGELNEITGITLSVPVFCSSPVAVVRQYLQYDFPSKNLFPVHKNSTLYF